MINQRNGHAGIYTSIAVDRPFDFIYSSPRRLKGWKLALVRQVTLLVLSR